MAYATQRLTQTDVNRIIKEVDADRAAGRNAGAGLIADGNGLYLQRPNLSYISRLRFGGRRIEPGHGSARRVKLAEARTAHDAALRMVRAGKNPVTAKLLARSQAAAIKTFIQAARAFMPTIEAELKSAKSIAVWRATLLGEVVDSDGKVTRAKHNYCAKIHHVPVADITTPLVLAVLKPIWVTKSETASRLRGRIERCWRGPSAKAWVATSTSTTIATRRAGTAILSTRSPTRPRCTRYGACRLQELG